MKRRLSALNAAYSLLIAKASPVPQLTAQEYQAAAAAIAEMKQTLVGMIRAIPPNSYCDSSQFLTDLQVRLKLLADSTN